jgi:hypothetical protein
LASKEKGTPANLTGSERPNTPALQKESNEYPPQTNKDKEKGHRTVETTRLRGRQKCRGSTALVDVILTAASSTMSQ